MFREIGNIIVSVECQTILTYTIGAFNFQNIYYQKTNIANYSCSL